jgi:hypothetical protein
VRWVVDGWAWDGSVEERDAARLARRAGSWNWGLKPGGRRLFDGSNTQGR